MFVNITHDTKAEHRKLFVAGVGYLTAMAVLIGLSIAIYQKVFTPVTMVTVKADRAGLQLARFGDVRLHGVLVGQIRSISQDGTQAVIKLGLQPDAAKAIPENIDVQILPTTLFGQKYVSLVDPASPATAAIRDGAVIPSSRVQTSAELEQILANLFPLLRSVRPADLSATLHALAQGLSGRGERLGETMTVLNRYLGTMNQHLPTMKADLQKLADVSETYQLAAPDLIRLLRNATVTARTVSTKGDELAGFYSSMIAVSHRGTRILKTNGDQIITSTRLAVPLTRLLDTYSPEYTCLLQGLDRYTGRLSQIFRNRRVSQTMIMSGRQRNQYGRADRPVYGEVGHGPWCLGLPTPKEGAPLAPVTVKDGTAADNPPRSTP